MKKTVLVTGASSGMGKETAKLLAQNGYKVYAAARRLEQMDDLKPLGIATLKMDVSDEQSMINGVDEIFKAEGKIDILINNAGFGQYGAIEEVDLKDARYQMEVNLFGLARLIQLVIPHMREQYFGKIVNISSVGGKMAAPLGGWYHASKFALEGLSDSLRLELKPFGIDVIVIEPGGVKTEWGTIAIGNAMKTAEGSSYKGLIESAQKISEKTEKNNIPAIEIAVLIKDAIEVAKPKARYAKGYLAKPVLFMKRWLSDSALDKVIMGQLK
ncbi:oxidoreductase [Mucilaginibacter endophyticus]|uniref:oxidoreductase n=1 Tax=Mucilaginibacter endophyticus TaxID=2675003 RepID=UPI000E0D0249|nr:oxidoreductase [Mucilaginibacter endophyticus]